MKVKATKAWLSTNDNHLVHAVRIYDEQVAGLMERLLEACLQSSVGCPGKLMIVGEDVRKAWAKMEGKVKR